MAMAAHIQRENEARTWWGWFKHLFCTCSPPKTSGKKVTLKEGRRPLLQFTPA